MSRGRSPGRALGRVGAALLALVLLAALLAPVLSRYGPREEAGAPGLAPTWQHPLGTNDVGQDLLAQVLFGAQTSLTIGVLAAAFGLAVGMAVALVAAYRGGSFDSAAMRLVDLTLAFPFIPLVLVLAAFLGRGLIITVLVIAFVIWAQPARVLRAHLMKVLSYGHVQVAQAMGLSTHRILTRHLLPRAAPLAAGQFVRAANIAISIEAALSFLGLGDPNRMSWGTMLFFANARNAILTDAWLWWILPPGLGLTATIVGFAFVGYAVEEWGDRRLSGTGAAVRRRRFRVASDVRKSQRTAHTAAADNGHPAPALELGDLHVHYHTEAGAVRAVDGVDLSVSRHRLMGLVGESGCGKTTLAMTLLGLIPEPGQIVGGSIQLGGQELTALRPSEMRRLRGRKISLVPQSAMNALNPAYPVRRQIAEATRQTRDEDAALARADEVMSEVGLAADRGRRYPHQLSGGMRQRAVLAIALANDPDVVVADEPLTGLDVITQARIVQLLLDLQQRRQLTVLLVSHDLPLLARVVDDLVVMYAGRVVETGPAHDVARSPQHPYTQLLLQAYPHLRGPRRELVTLTGRPPDLHHPPSGCRFQPRCPKAIASCEDTVPQLTDRGPKRRAACLLEQP